MLPKYSKWVIIPHSQTKPSYHGLPCFPEHTITHRLAASPNWASVSRCEIDQISKNTQDNAFDKWKFLRLLKTKWAYKPYSHLENPVVTLSPWPRAKEGSKSRNIHKFRLKMSRSVIVNVTNGSRKLRNQILISFNWANSTHPSKCPNQVTSIKWSTHWFTNIQAKAHTEIAHFEESTKMLKALFIWPRPHLWIFTQENGELSFTWY